MPNFHSAVISGTHSSVGKTTWSLGLMAFFRQKGLEVQPFKVGPDYIDTGFHHWSCRPRKSRNLDRFFLPESYLKDCFRRHSGGADLALVEGVMGLFDGRGALSEEGSTAQMAKLLDLPVLLVVDGSGLARSAAALVKGYQSFDDRLNLSGVLLNRVGSEGHFRLLRESIEKETQVPVLGWLPADPGLGIPERHLGLRTALEEEGVSEKVNQIVRNITGRFDENRFLNLTTRPRPSLTVPTVPSERKEKKTRIGVAYDRAFSFYYEDNFDLLRDAGAELVFFSPLSDALLPPDLDALYLGGGFPEIHAGDLSGNQAMKTRIRQFHQEGGLLYAECGGLIYLAGGFIDCDGKEYPLAGLLPGKIRMMDRLQHFGYHEIETAVSTFLFEKGTRLRSHEFHYSTWEFPSGPMLHPYRIGDRREGFWDGRVLASYQHLHFGQDPEMARRFVRAAKEKRAPVNVS